MYNKAKSLVERFSNKKQKDQLTAAGAIASTSVTTSIITGLTEGEKIFIDIPPWSDWEQYVDQNYQKANTAIS